jgi:hypothetical protein
MQVPGRMAWWDIDGAYYHHRRHHRDRHLYLYGIGRERPRRFFDICVCQVQTNLLESPF